MQLHQLEPGLFAASEPSLRDLPALLGRGIRTLVDSRLDDRGMDSVPMLELKEAAARLGMQYVHTPVPLGVDDDELHALRAALRQLPRPTLLFSHSEVRSASAYVRAQRLQALEHEAS